MVATDPKRPVHMACVADAANFGDALFPLLAQERLAHHGFALKPLTITGRTPAWPDALASISLRDMIEQAPDSAGMLIGGGNLIVGSAASKTEAWLGKLWLGSSWHAVVHDLPLLWNAPGVLRDFGALPLDRIADAAVQAADRLVVRDRFSAQMLTRERSDIAVVPDTVCALATLWPRAVLEPIFRDFLASRAWKGDRPLVVVHVRDKTGEPPSPAIALAIEAAAARDGWMPLLLAIGRAVRDDAVLHGLSRQLRVPHLLVDAPVSLKQIAAILACCNGFVGQSLHGCIAAAAYDVPGVLVSPPPASRLRGFLAGEGRENALIDNWGDAFARLSAMPAVMPLAGTSMARIDAHWRETAALLTTPHKRTDARLSLLRHVAALGSRHAGADWSLKPLSSFTYSGRQQS